MLKTYFESSMPIVLILQGPAFQQLVEVREFKLLDLESRSLI